GSLAHIAGVDADRGGVVLQRLVAQSPDLGPGGLGFEQGVVHPGEDLLLGVAAHWNSAPFLQRLHSRAWCSPTPEKITARAPQVTAMMPRISPVTRRPPPLTLFFIGKASFAAAEAAVRGNRP